MITHGRSFDLGDLGEIVFVVDTVAQNISKVSKCTFQSICCPLLFGFLECGRFSLAILDVTVANVLPILLADVLE